jgi:hypothetical protein
MSFGEAFFILLAERGVMPKEGLWMVLLYSLKLNLQRSEAQHLYLSQ